MVGELEVIERSCNVMRDVGAAWFPYENDANIALTGITLKSKKKKNKKKGGSQGANNVEENAELKGKHDEAEVDHEEDADEDGHTV